VVSEFRHGFFELLPAVVLAAVVLAVVLVVVVLLAVVEATVLERKKTQRGLGLAKPAPGMLRLCKNNSWKQKIQHNNNTTNPVVDFHPHGCRLACARWRLFV
jgi:hypothetical protein